MNCKLYTLLLTLTLSMSPSLQAMRARSSVTAARSLYRPSFTKVPAQALARTYPHTERRERFRDGAHGYMPAAIAIGLGLTAQHAIEELDIYDMDAVLKVLKNGTEDEKLLVTEKIAQKITRYKVKDVINMLQHTKNEPHRTLVTAVANNITSLTLQQIAQILKSDTQDETHALIAGALKKNYNYFTGYSVMGYRITSSQEYIFEYAQTLQCLQKKYQSDAMQSLAHDNKNTIFALGCDLDNVLKTSPAVGKPIIIRAIMQNAHDGKISTTLTQIINSISKKSLFYAFSDLSLDRIRNFPLRLFCKVSLKVTEKKYPEEKN